MNKRFVDEWNSVCRGYGTLVELHLRRSTTGGSAEPWVLEVVLAAQPEVGAQKARLYFAGVRGLKMGRIDGLLKLLLVVTDCSERQMEDIRLCVEEEEHGQLFFWCASFEFALE